ncbi:MAG: biotin--[acetyl-CoA-carboxylase] ligase [Alphaproteobacteria bacterium]|nr:MAG: biotin--[acetyl-CoA-carboxylase] ligase [Alphaproteobacteria bacterium]TAF14667.1 MAG: biotin--[acetyl-CoA-carboxylase] ligase [Alphaproteobacteria bacterium]TAF41251.1 MAG: biotin--[acetyl-CoA-carboxylase] ligase [Alphaproteobacteria bacterium]TAF75763.1 MAG: biotin--[acetyl-CoA-carboxylase] ligase [Alphaproteobacteria bacterium]
MAGSTLHFIDSYHLLTFDELDSTNEEAKRLAKAGGQHGAVLWAKTQTHGKGRDGRQWVSEEGNLFFSLLLQPCASVERLPQLSFVASLALYQALAYVLNDPTAVTLKWPNDVLVHGKKVAGILLETVLSRHQDASWVIIGVGVNIMHHPEDASYPATNIHAHGVEIISAKIVLSRFLDAFDALYDEWLDKGFAYIRDQWCSVAAHIGKEIVLEEAGNNVTQATMCAIGDDGALIVETEHGTRSVYAADVRVVMPSVRE